MPLVAVLPLTVIVAEPWLAVGVTVTWATELFTPAAYVMPELENAGLSVPELIVRSSRSALLDRGAAARVMVTV